MHVVFPPIETFTPADLREGRASTAITRNNAFREAGKAIEKAGGTFSYAEPPEPVRLVDGLLIFPKDWPPD
ncbi:hypothetical protein O1V64_00245 (plasmid) [Rouxiella badensis]|uniref:Uncharacterized protein n=1 Tax=Rouxiella badensis TaxID=1646377 RepID=A0A1X0WB03_9GAMM|nr:hypothetical protein [Rouxiella badensis]ORJ23944.1 hypothetical protein BS640_18760 [Rouxiella badensis]WAT03192.1 hypothetical protein O1V64_00470 [Rouxiella badensis]WAT03287.1 hypothetical protein O1V64_00245 [Rouxiella badensis]